MNSRMLRIFIIIIGVLFVISAAFFKDQYAHEEELENQDDTFVFQPENSTDNIFINRVGGYTIRVPNDMQADMQFSNIRAVLESEALRVEIYRQKIQNISGSGIESYINYSNRFMDNQTDHKKESAGKIKIGSRWAPFLEWSRKPLKNIENDRCYYASVDVPLSDREVLTFMFKSNQKYRDKSYLNIVESLTIIERTRESYAHKILKTDNRGWDEKTDKLYDELFGENSQFHWGIFENNAPLDYTELKKIEEKVDFTFPILIYYTAILENQAHHPHLADALKNAKCEDRILELTLQTAEQSEGKGNMVYDVLAGDYDTYLFNYAREVALSDEPVLFRLGNEMNGDWCVYSAYHTSKDTEIFKAFYRYVYEIFQTAGADNVIWIWNPNSKSYPDFKWNDELCYYPGDEYVDVVGMTGYNTGTYYEGETWMEFDEIYDNLYKKYKDYYEKPLMITEFSCSSIGGSKEEWVDNMFRHISKYERIKAAIWWDGCDWDKKGNISRPYFIDETEELVQLFRNNLKRFK
ncbi:MAG: glycosyl hydrolase [Eubacteriales bacterium]|nr:glycosyl hydrolase [Eubacteriales bacterium]